jgi:hypothetical protein
MARSSNLRAIVTSRSDEIFANHRHDIRYQDVPAVAARMISPVSMRRDDVIATRVANSCRFA